MSRRVVTFLATALGIALLAWQVRLVGLGHILEQFRQIGPVGFALILSATLVRQLCRTTAWTLLMDAGVPLRHAFTATMSGDAIGNLTPLSLLASEPAKAMFVREFVPPPRALAALTAENFLYGLSVITAVLFGVSVLFLRFAVGGLLRTMSLSLVAAMLAILIIALWLLWQKPALISVTLGRFLGERRVEKVRALEATTYEFVRTKPIRLAGVVACEATFHLMSIAESWITLHFLGIDSISLAIVLDIVQRVITVVFRMIPGRIGIDGGGSGLMTELLDLGHPLGVTMGLIRNIRVLIWSGIGLLLLLASRKLEATSK